MSYEEPDAMYDRDHAEVELEDERQKFVQVDNRRRVSLSGIGRGSDKVYLVDEQSDGVIVLTPAVFVPKKDLEGKRAH
jgi:hypothetical protein